MKKILIFLLLTLLLLSGVGKLAERPIQQLEPLPSLEAAPNYGGPPIEFVHC